MKSHTDPVCGMKLEKKDAAGLDEYEGRTYYFDSEDCMKLFQADPDKYADKGIVTVRSKGN